MEGDDEVQKCVILLAYANNEPINGRTKLQKMMFLLSDVIDEIKERRSYGADNYGPHSKVVDKEFQYLEQAGVLSGGSREIAITAEGREIAKEIMKKEDNNTFEILS